MKHSKKFGVTVLPIKKGDIRDDAIYGIGEVVIKRGRTFLKSEKQGEVELEENTVVEECDSYMDAELLLKDIIYRNCVGRVIDLLKSGDLPNRFIRPEPGVKYSGNPLRFLEKDIGPIGSRLIWAEGTSGEKILVIIGVCIDNIRVLISVIDLLLFANDYTKKVLGKYVVVELYWIYQLLGKLSKTNREYRDNEYRELEEAVLDLEKSNNLQGLRNKIAAHMDVDIGLSDYIKYWNNLNIGILTEYYELLARHVYTIIEKHYSPLKRLYFDLTEAEGTRGVKVFPRDGYVPFDKFEI
jgi:hypothetical protein